MSKFITIETANCLATVENEISLSRIIDENFPVKQLQIDGGICTCCTLNEILIELNQIFSSFQTFVLSKAI